MEIWRTLATVLPLGLSSGINLYATVLIIGLSIRFGWVQDAPQGLAALAAWPVLAVALLFYTLEFFADKIQFVDNLWDLLHTFVRPVGAAILAWAALGHLDPVLVAVGTLAAGSAALVSHGSKAGTRVALNVVSPLENLSNIAISLAEDVFAGGLAFLALKYPLAAGLGSLVVLALMVMIVPQLLRWAWLALRSVGAWIAALTGHKQSRSDTLPGPYAAAIGAGQTLQMIASGKAQGVGGAGGRSGYVVLTPANMYFVYPARTSSGVRTWQIARSAVASVSLTHRALLDVITLDYRDAEGRRRTARLVFLKDRGPLAEQCAALLAGPLSNAVATPVLPLGTP